MEKETGIKTREGREKEAEEKYAADSETGVIRLAKEGEKAVSLFEAQKLQRLIKKDLAELEGYRRQKGAGLRLGWAGRVDAESEGQNRLR